MTQNNQNLIDKIATPIRIECKVSWECACRVASQILEAIELDEEAMKEILQIELCNGTTDCENSPECPTEDGCQPFDLAQAIASAKEKVVRVR